MWFWETLRIAVAVLGVLKLEPIIEKLIENDVGSWFLATVLSSAITWLVSQYALGRPVLEAQWTQNGDAVRNPLVEFEPKRAFMKYSVTVTLSCQSWIVGSIVNRALGPSPTAQFGLKDSSLIQAAADGPGKGASSQGAMVYCLLRDQGGGERQGLARVEFERTDTHDADVTQPIVFGLRGASRLVTWLIRRECVPTRLLIKGK